MATEAGRIPQSAAEFRRPLSQDNVTEGSSALRLNRDQRPPITVSNSDNVIHVDFQRRARIQTLPDQESFSSLSPRATIYEASIQSEKDNTHEFFSKEWMQQEVERVRKEPVPAGETPWYHLAGTGFWVKEQVSQLLRNVQNVGEEAFPDVLEKELSKVEVDIKAFEDEYLKGMASLKWNLAWTERNGEKQIMCPDYKGAGKNSEGMLLSEVTGKEERDGAVYETLFGDETKGTTGVQGWLRKAPANSHAVIVSPMGWSGLRDADGKEIRFPESQIYVITKGADGSIQGHTFRTDATLVQNEKFQELLGQPIKPADRLIDRIKNTLANVALLTPEDAVIAEQNGRRGIRSVEDVVNVLQDSLDGREVAYGEGGDMKTFADIRAFLDDPELFSQQHPLTDRLINRLKEYSRWRLTNGREENTVETDLQIAFGMTPLHLNKLYREKKRLKELGEDSVGMEYYVDHLVRHAQSGMNYKHERNELEEIPGCGGGGRGQSMYALGVRRIGQSIAVSGEDSRGSLHFDCPHCGFTNQRDPGVLLANCKNVPDCGKDVTC